MSGKDDAWDDQQTPCKLERKENKTNKKKKNIEECFVLCSEIKKLKNRNWKKKEKKKRVKETKKK